MSKRDMFRFAYMTAMTTGSDTAEMSLYGQIIDDMPEEWKWSKEDKSAAEFKRTVEELREKGANKLLLRINSPGGICTESIAMRSILASAGFEDITIRIEGLCASAATNIATIPGAHVQIAAGSEYMIHNPWTMIVGSAEEMEHAAERLRNIEDMTRGFYVKRTGQSDEQVKEWMDAETWFTAEQAVEAGFADEILDGEEKAVACVSAEEAEVMRSLYKSVPSDMNIVAHSLTLGSATLNRTLTIEGEDGLEICAPQEVTNGTPNAGEPSEINEQEENPPMELKDLTVEQLREENPALFESIEQSAVTAERERLADIDALTIPGYEDLAVQAKADGTSALEFQKQIVAAMKKKGETFLKDRAAETAPAQDVAGDAPSGKSEEQEIKDLAASIAGYANGDGRTDGMF